MPLSLPCISRRRLPFPCLRYSDQNGLGTYVRYIFRVVIEDLTVFRRAHRPLNLEVRVGAELFMLPPCIDCGELHLACLADDCLALIATAQAHTLMLISIGFRFRYIIALGTLVVALC